MWKDFSDCQEYVYQNLSQRENTTLSVKKICNEFSMDRSMFYRRFQGKREFFALCMQYRCREEIKKQTQRGIKQDFYTLLKHIKQEQIYYHNIYQITKNSCICHLLKKQLEEVIKKYLPYVDHHHCASLVEDIYCQLYHWLVHHCQRDIDEVWRNLDTILTRIEKVIAKQKDLSFD